MRVPVQTDFVTAVSDQGAFFGEGLEGVAGDEPGSFYIVLLEEFEKAADADCACEETWERLVIRD